MAIARPIFKGTYEGKNIWDYKCKLDYSIEDLDTRKEEIYKLLNIVKEGDCEFTNDLFWKEVWDTGVCKSELNTTDFLWSETNIATTLEGLANYLLAKDDKDTKTNYKIYKKENDFRDALYKEKKAIIKYGEEISPDGESGFKILIPTGNYKLDPKPCIKKSDLNKIELLNDYQRYLDYLSNIMKNDNLKAELLNTLKKRGITRYTKESQLYGFLINTTGEIKKDMLALKKHYEQPIKWKQPLKDGGFKSYEELDMMDKKHVTELLRLHRETEVVDFQNDLDCIIYDLNNLINECEFTETQLKVLKMYSRGMTLEKIADALDIKQHSVINRHINAIINKIIKKYEEHYLDWYKLNVVKGVYKKCSQCEEIKLIELFNKEPKGTLGVKSKCKKCQNK